ncbi:hypothetical protein QFZ80_004394 [Paenibacillus sp. V4I7]|nr:hypothetical protein [Paenibacillus sp. V4I7]MDQ0920927.1 hypothetical protein [Paenibacillus sp. V4I5]
MSVRILNKQDYYRMVYGDGLGKILEKHLLSIIAGLVK